MRRNLAQKVFLRSPHDPRFSAAMLTDYDLTIKDCSRQVSLDLTAMGNDVKNDVKYAHESPRHYKQALKDLHEDLEMLEKLQHLIGEAKKRRLYFIARALKAMEAASKLPKKPRKKKGTEEFV